MHLRVLTTSSTPSIPTTRLFPSSILNHTSIPHHKHHHQTPSIKQPTQPFHTTTSPLLKSKTPQLPPRPTLPDSELKHTYLKGSGPGGQKINKTSSAVQLTHLPTGIVVKSQATRSQKQNHNIARKILAEKIDFIERGGESRRAKVIELKVKRKGSAAKKRRRKYRLLNGEKYEGKEGEEIDGEEVERGSEEKGMVEEDLKRERSK